MEGKNYYAIKKITKQERQEFHKKLDEFLDGNLENLKLSKTVVHLGKLYPGWQFLWQNNPDYYEPDLSSIMNFLLLDDYFIVDDNLKFITLDQFIEDEIGEYLYHGYTFKTYNEEKCPELLLEHCDYITKDGLRFVDGDFR